MNDSLLNEWVDATIAREQGDSDQAKTQAIVAGKFVLAEAGAPVGISWEDIPKSTRDAAITTLFDRAKDLGLDIARHEITKQTRIVIDRAFVLPEQLAFKVVYEAYAANPKVTTERHQKLDLLLRVARGEDIEEIPEHIRKRIARRVRLGKRYLVAATDLREACGRLGYLMDTDRTKEALEADPKAALALLMEMAKDDPDLREAAQDEMIKIWEYEGTIRGQRSIDDDERWNTTMNGMENSIRKVHDLDYPDEYADLTSQRCRKQITMLEEAAEIAEARRSMENL